MNVRVLVVAALLLGLGVWYFVLATSHDDEPTYSIRELKTTYYATADEWLPFYTEYLPNGTGWALLPKYTNSAPIVVYRAPDGGREIVTPDVCGECHGENYVGWQATAHAKTSSVATRETVLGSFADGSNVHTTADPSLSFVMKADGDVLSQEVRIRKDGRTYTHRKSIDIVTGSGNHGQSYLTWDEDRLYQLPLTYFTALDRWVTSPGIYIDGTADFARPIGARCLDCHATWFGSALGDANYNRYETKGQVLGVTCVRCHGPGEAHVEYHRANPDVAEGKHIVNPTALTPEQTNAVCAQCHSGVGVLLGSPFSYRPGQSLEKYVHLDFDEASGMNEDPHAANQLARLQRSACFMNSDAMTCATCHDPHRHERGDLQKFSAQCMQCHEPAACGMEPTVGVSIRNDCISCHMPLTEDLMAQIEIEGKRLMPKLREHYIKVWPKVSARILLSRKK